MKKIALLLALLLAPLGAHAQTTDLYRVATIAALKALNPLRPPIAVVMDTATGGEFKWGTSVCSAADDIYQVTPTAGPTGCWTRLSNTYAIGLAPDVSRGLVTATGSVTARSLAVRESNFVNALDWGVVADGSTDDRAALQNALNSFGVAGGTVFIPPGKSVAITSGNLTIPSRVTLDLGLNSADFPRNWQSTDLASWAHISLSSSYTITLIGRIQNGLILRQGITIPAGNALAFAGTAITTSSDGATAKNMMVLGFASCFTATSGSRIRLEGKFYADCTASSSDVAVSLNDSFDSTRIEDLHLWPYVTVGRNAVVSGTYNNGTGVVTLTMGSLVTVSEGNTFTAGFTGTGAFGLIDGTHTALAGTTGSTVVFNAGAALGASTITGGLLSVVTAAITSGTYNSGTGAVTLTLTTPMLSLVPGVSLKIASLTGTGGYASLNGAYVATAGTNSTTVNFTAATGLGATTITGGAIDDNNNYIQREGYGLRTSGQSDDTYIQRAFVGGYLVGIQLGSNGNISANSMWAEYYGTRTGQQSFRTANSLNKVAINTLYGYSGYQPIVFNHTTGTVSVGQIIAAYAGLDNITVTTGNVYVAQTQTTNATRYGITGANTSASYYVKFDKGWAQSNGGTEYFAVPSGATTDKFYIGLDTDQAAGGFKFGGFNNNFPSIASADPLNIPPNATDVTVTGTTSFGTLVAGLSSGAVLRLHFTGALTVFSGGGTMVLQGGVNFVTAAGSILTLVNNAGVWYETSRTGPTTGTGSQVLSENPTFTGTLTALVTATGSTTARSLATRFADFKSVRDFGADPGNSAAANTVAFDAALAAGDIYVPAGTYQITSLASFTGRTIAGEGRENTTLATTSATADVVTVGTYATISNIQFQATVTRTAGSYIKVNGGEFLVDSVIFAGHSTGITISDTVGGWRVLNSLFGTTVTTGAGIKVGTGTGASPVAGLISNVLMSYAANTGPAAGIDLVNSGDVAITDSHIIHAQTGLRVRPGTGQGVFSTKTTNAYFDQADNYGIDFAPTGTGGIYRSHFHNSWATQAGTANVRITATAPAIVDGVTFVDLDNSLSVNGIVATGTGVSNVQVLGGGHAQNSGAALTFTDITSFSVIGARVGSGFGFLGNATGIVLSGTSTSGQIHSNSITGNTVTGVTNSASGSNNFWANYGVADSILGVASGGTGSGSAFTTGSIPFSVAGVYTQNNSAFFWDNSYGRLAINNAAAATRELQIGGGSAGIRLGSNASSAYLDLYRDAATGEFFYNSAQTTFAGHRFKVTGTDVLSVLAVSVIVAQPLVYGGVTLANSVTGTGSMVLSASPTFTGTLTATAGVFSATVGTGGYTVAALPAAPGTGARAYVTNQLTTCAVTGAALTGGGAVTCPVFYNGTAWVGG